MSCDILLSQIDADPNQPRKHFDHASIEELAQSMDANGLAVPILVRPVGERYMIVHGERRWRAAQLLGWEAIPAEVRNLSEEDAHWLALVENVQRADLSPIEEACAYQAYLSTGITQEELGRRIGKSRTHIATMLRFLKLPDDAQQALASGAITEGHAKQLLRLDDAAGMSALCTDIVANKSSVRDVASIVDSYLQLDHNIQDLMKYSVEIGKHLREIKRTLPPHMWEPYLKSKEVEWTPTLADQLIALADNPPQRLDDIPEDVFDGFLWCLIEWSGSWRHDRSARQFEKHVLDKPPYHKCVT